MPRRGNYIAVVQVLLLALFTSCHPVSEYINSEEVLHWEEDIQLFDSLNLVEIPDENSLMVAGSSSVRLWDSIQSDLAPYHVIRRGYGGAKLTDFNYYVNRIIEPGKFKAILIFVANDIKGGDTDRTPREVFLLYRTLMKQLLARNPETPLFWIEVTPTPNRWNVIDEVVSAGDMIRDYSNRHKNLYYIDTYDIFMNGNGMPDPAYFRNDMLHLNREGYEIWSERIKQSLLGNGIYP
jgi:GDSL-like Lipase/Acylhydrolase family